MRARRAAGHGRDPPRARGLRRRRDPRLRARRRRQPRPARRREARRQHRLGGGAAGAARRRGRARRRLQRPQGSSRGDDAGVLAAVAARVRRRRNACEWQGEGYARASRRTGTAASCGRARIARTASRCASATCAAIATRSRPACSDPRARRAELLRPAAVRARRQQPAARAGVGSGRCRAARSGAAQLRAVGGAQPPVQRGAGGARGARRLEPAAAGRGRHARRPPQLLHRASPTTRRSKRVASRWTCIRAARCRVAASRRRPGEARAVEDERDRAARRRWSALLARERLDHERRSLRLPVREFDWSFGDDDTLVLRFVLPRGTFATAVLHELLADAWDAGEAARSEPCLTSGPPAARRPRRCRRRPAARWRTPRRSRPGAASGGRPCFSTGPAGPERRPLP